jgi:hypothetical protein
MKAVAQVVINIGPLSKYVLARCWWLTPIILATQVAETRRITVQSQPWANSLRDPISNKQKKKNHKTGAGGVAQVVECLPSKHKTLSSNPSTGKKKKNCTENQLQSRHCLGQQSTEKSHCPGGDIQSGNLIALEMEQS